MFWPILPSLFCSLACWLRCVDKTHPVQKAWGEFCDYFSIKPKLYWMIFVVQLDLSQEFIVLRQPSLRIEKKRIVDALIFSFVGVISCLIYIRIVFLPSARILSLTYSLLQIFLFVFRVHIAHLDPAGSEIVADDWISSRGSRLFRHSSHLFLGCPRTRWPFRIAHWICFAQFEVSSIVKVWGRLFVDIWFVGVLRVSRRNRKAERPKTNPDAS